MEVIRKKVVKTHKDHACWGCKEVMPAGTNMLRVISADSGMITTAYWCDECQEKLSELESWQLEDGFEFGELLKMQ